MPDTSSYANWLLKALPLDEPSSHKALRLFMKCTCSVAIWHERPSFVLQKLPHNSSRPALPLFATLSISAKQHPSCHISARRLLSRCATCSGARKIYEQSSKLVDPPRINTLLTPTSVSRGRMSGELGLWSKILSGLMSLCLIDRPCI